MIDHFYYACGDPNITTSDKHDYVMTTSMNVNIALCRFLHNHDNIATEGNEKNGVLGYLCAHIG